MKFRIRTYMAAYALLWPVASFSANGNDSLVVIHTDTVNVLPELTVTDERQIMAKETLQMGSTTVTGSGSLTVTAEKDIIVVDELMVMPGGTLLLNSAGQYAIRYYYDASGNRTTKIKDTTVQ